MKNDKPNLPELISTRYYEQHQYSSISQTTAPSENAVSHGKF